MMVGKYESEREESETQDLSISKNNPKPDTEEILRRQGPEFEPPKEDIAEKQQGANQGTDQTVVGTSTDSTNKTSDEEAQKEKDAALTREIEKLEQEENALKNQKLAELREQLQKIRQNQEQEAQQSNSDTGQNEDYYQGMGQ